MLKRKSAFTLVELMVAMSIIAVLIGLAVFGISTAQRNLRDNQRRDVVKNIAAGLADYYSSNFAYPNPSPRTFTRLNTTLSVPVTGITAAATTTTANGTQYCYFIATDGYVLGARLESGNWFDLGSSSSKCGDSATYAIAP